MNQPDRATPLGVLCSALSLIVFPNSLLYVIGPAGIEGIVGTFDHIHVIVHLGSNRRKKLTSRLKGLGMFPVPLPVRHVQLRQFLRLQYQEVLGILLLGSLGEVEAARYHRLPVDDHDLVVGDSMGIVDEGGYA